MMTKNEFQILKKARKTLRKLAKDETIKSSNKLYYSYIAETYDSLDMFVYYMKTEKLVKG
jgi:hypothetical protein